MMRKYILGIGMILFFGNCQMAAIYSYTFEATCQKSSTDSCISMTLEFGSEPIFWEINGKRFEQIEYECLESQFSIAPSIYCISAQEGDERHILCGMFYNSCCPQMDRFGGLYRHEYRCTPHKEEDCVDEFPFELIDSNSEYR